jgi:hypothetical protein
MLVLPQHAPASSRSCFMVYFLRGQPSIAFEPDEALATAPRAQFTLLFFAADRRSFC